MMQWIKRLIVVLVLVLFVGTLLFLYQKSREETQPFQIGQPFMADIVQKTVVTGTIVPRKEIEIKPQIIGIIDEMMVQPGDQVKKGDLIARIRVTPNMVTLNNAQTRFNQAQIALDDARLDFKRQKDIFDRSFNNGKLVLRETNPAMIKLNSSLYRLESAKLMLEDAQTEVKNQRLLLEKEVISPETFQNVELTLKKAQSDYKEAARNYQLVREETLQLVEEELQKATLALKKTEAEFIAARNNLQLIREGVTEENADDANTLIRSTIDGMVLDVLVEEGNLVIESSSSYVGTTVAIVADMNDMIFKGNIDESEVGKIREGMALTLSIGAIEGEIFNAEIEFIAPKGEKVSGATQFEIRAKLKLKRTVFVRAGYSANADIVLEKRNGVLAIKERWLQFDRGMPFVELETSEGGFEKREIEVGISDGLTIEVLSGLKLSDRIKIPD